MVTTDKISCNIITSVLVKHGVREMVISPGSRNAPMVVAVARDGNISTTVVIDERSAAFIALGKAALSRCPVALLCTSGTAVLNYAPAVAEAYYRGIPLIVISADRPMEWIDQDDSQTLRQYEALAHYVKRSYNLPADCRSDSIQWYVNRVANDAILCATTGRKAPVHINLQLDEPLGGMTQARESRWIDRMIGAVVPELSLSASDCFRMAGRLARCPRVMVIAGFHDPDAGLSEALGSLAERDNIVVMTERISNLVSSGNRFIDCIDSTLSIMTDEEKDAMRPEIIITFGGAIVSRFVKQYLRNTGKCEHWHVGVTEATVDCLKSLALAVGFPPARFFAEMRDAISSMPSVKSDFAARWHDYAVTARRVHEDYVDRQPWSDMTAMRRVMEWIPEGWNVQLSNGTAVRYAQLFTSPGASRFDCNRGVSGIDGSVSTAIGASTVYDGVTLLVTGDMSAQYDVGALAAPCITPRFKMIVLCNGGGGIFRFIKSTSALDELERYFVVERPFPLQQLSAAYGFRYFQVSSESELSCCLDEFASEKEHPCILALITPGEESAAVLRNYFSVKP